MADLRQMTDDEVRRRYADEFGIPVSDVMLASVDLLRAVLADIDEQVETYVAIGAAPEGVSAP